MMNRNTIDLSSRLFARKGEAVPSTHSAASAPANGKATIAPKAGPSPLSFLIERRVGPCAVAQDEIPVAPKTPSVNGKPFRLVSVIEGQQRPKSPRRQLTLRLQPEDFERFRFLAETYGATYQSVLERAVTGYVEEITPFRGRRGIC